jgi:hypothetical protein
VAAGLGAWAIDAVARGATVAAWVAAGAVER